MTFQKTRITVSLNGQYSLPKIPQLSGIDVLIDPSKIVRKTMHAFYYSSNIADV